MSITMQNLFIKKIQAEHKQRFLNKFSHKNELKKEKDLVPIVINTDTIFEDIKYQKLKGCICNTIDNPLSCQICFFSLLSLHPNYKYTKTRLDKLLEFKENNGDILSLPLGYTYCLEKIKNK